MISFLAQVLIHVGTRNAILCKDGSVGIPSQSLTKLPVALQGDIGRHWARRQPQLLLRRPEVRQHWRSSDQCFGVDAIHAAAICLGLPAEQYAWANCRREIRLHVAGVTGAPPEAETAAAEDVSVGVEVTGVPQEMLEEMQHAMQH